MNEPLDILNFLTQKKIVSPLLIIVGGYIIYKIVSSILDRVVLGGRNELEKKRRRTILDLLQNIFKYLVYICILLAMLEVYGINTKNLIAGLGIAGVLIGLALQDTLRDLINGISIILDNYYILGDTIEYENFKGEVILLGLRSTKIKKQNGEVLTFANRNVNKVINYSQKSANIQFDIITSNETNIKKAEKIIVSVFDEITIIPEVKKDGIVYLGIEAITNTSIIHTISIKCERLSGDKVKREVNRLIKEAFEKNKITLLELGVHNERK